MIPPSPALEARLRQLKQEFPSILYSKRNDHNRSDRVVQYRDASPAGKLEGYFCGTRGALDQERREKEYMGIMYHGTHRDNVYNICQEGFHFGSSFTSSLDYAVRRSDYKEERRNSHVQVIAVATISDRREKFEGKDERLAEQNFSLPLFIVEVKVR